MTSICTPTLASRYFLALLFSFLLALPQPACGSRSPAPGHPPDRLQLDAAFAANLDHPLLQQTFYRLKDKRPMLLTPLQNLYLAMQEPKHSYLAVRALLEHYNQAATTRQALKPNYHRLMCKALACASPQVVNYLFKRGVFDPRYLAHTPPPYSFLSHYPIWRWVLEFWYTDPWPTWTAYPLRLWKTVNLCVYGIKIITWLVGNRLYPAWLRHKISVPLRFHSYLNYWVMPLLWLTKAGYMAYMGQHVGYQPSYLVRVLYNTRRDKQTQTALALMLLRRGASPTGALLVAPHEPSPLLPPELVTFFRPSTYIYVTPLHLAARADLIQVVQALLALKVDREAVAWTMRDEVVDYEAAVQTIRLPVRYVPLFQLYCQAGPGTHYRTPLDMAPKDSETYNLLRSAGARHHHELSPPAQLKPGLKGRKKATKLSKSIAHSTSLPKAQRIRKPA